MPLSLSLCSHVEHLGSAALATLSLVCQSQTNIQMSISMISFANPPLVKSMLPLSLSLSLKMQSCHFRGMCDDGHRLEGFFCLGAVDLSNIQRLSTLLVYIWSLGCVLGTVTQGRNPGAACAAGFQCWKPQMEPVSLVSGDTRWKLFCRDRNHVRLQLGVTAESITRGNQ